MSDELEKDLKEMFDEIPKPADRRDRAMFVAGVAARRPQPIWRRALVPAMAMFLVLFALSIGSLEAAPGQTLYPLRNALSSVGLAEQPVEVVDRVIRRAEVSLERAEELLDENQDFAGAEAMTRQTLNHLGEANGSAERAQRRSPRGAGGRDHRSQRRCLRTARGHRRGAGRRGRGGAEESGGDDDNSGSGSEARDDDNSGSGSGSSGLGVGRRQQRLGVETTTVAPVRTTRGLGRAAPGLDRAARGLGRAARARGLASAAARGPARTTSRSTPSLSTIILLFGKTLKIRQRIRPIFRGRVAKNAQSGSVYFLQPLPDCCSARQVSGAATRNDQISRRECERTTRHPTAESRRWRNEPLSWEDQKEPRWRPRRCPDSTMLASS